MKGSILIISFFILGVLIGVFDILPAVIYTGNLSFYALAALMFCVGLSVGNDPGMIRNFQSLNPRLILLPVMTITGTLLGSFLVSFLLPGRSIAECMAVGSGLGYYSFSSIFITEYKGAELGTIALLSNISREVIALIFAPLFARYFGKLAPISVGGATTMDTTLPVIIRYSGKEYTIVSVYHGFIVDFSVILLVSFFCSI